MFRKAVRDITSRKMRTLLVVLSVAVGVFGISAVITLASQLQQTLDDQFNNSNPPDITITSSPLDPALVDQLAQVPNVQAVEVRLQAFAQWKPENEVSAIQIVGVRDFTPGRGIAQTTLKKGAFPGPGEIMFESASLSQYGVKVGATVTIVSASGEVPLRVSGAGQNINYPAAPVIGFATAFLNFPDAARLAGFDKPNALFVKLQDFSRADETLSALRGRLAASGALITGVTVREPDNPPGRDISLTLTSLLGVFAVTALVTSSFLLINTISTVIAEQRTQIGAMKAVGATTGIIMRIYLTLALLYGLLGTVLGLSLGIVGGYGLLRLLGSLIGVDVGGFSVAPGAVIVGAVVGLGMPLLAALVPVWLGSRVTTREAILSYGLSADFGRGLSGWIARALAFLPQTWVIASRNLLRNRTRVILTVVGLALAGMAMISVLDATTSLASTLNDAVETYQADLIVQSSTPVQESSMTAAIDTVPGVAAREGWFGTNAQTEGHSSDRIIGLPVATTAYDISKIVEGRWLQPGENDALVIPELMQRHRHYQVGDTIAVTVGDKVSQWRIVGVTRDLLSGDATFYAPIEAATRAAGAPPGTVQTVMVRLSDSSHANVDRSFDAINRALLDRGIATHSTVVYKFRGQVLQNFAILFVLLAIVVVIVAVVGALGLFGTITMNVLERRREIGVLRAVGAATGKVLAVFLTEGLLIGLVSWVAAAALSFAGVRVLGSLLTSVLVPVHVSVTVASLVITLVAILLVAFLAALLPSVGAARTRVAEILRYA